MRIIIQNNKHFQFSRENTWRDAHEVTKGRAIMSLRHTSLVYNLQRGSLGFSVGISLPDSEERDTEKEERRKRSL